MIRNELVNVNQNYLDRFLRHVFFLKLMYPKININNIVNGALNFFKLEKNGEKPIQDKTSGLLDYNLCHQLETSNSQKQGSHSDWFRSRICV